MHLEGSDERGGTGNSVARLLLHSCRQTPTGAVILASQLKGFLHGFTKRGEGRRADTISNYFVLIILFSS